jgi:hypothetical protein
VLRDLLDLDVGETADALSMSAANVRAADLRARRRLKGYGSQRVDISQARRPVRGSRSVSTILVETQRGLEHAEVVPSIPVLAGPPSLVLHVSAADHRFAQRIVLAIDVNGRGLITALYSAQAARQLTALPIPVS